jgi:hypothetical protein
VRIGNRLSVSYPSNKGAGCQLVASPRSFAVRRWTIHIAKLSRDRMQNAAAVSTEGLLYGRHRVLYATYEKSRRILSPLGRDSGSSGKGIAQLGRKVAESLSPCLRSAPARSIREHGGPSEIRGVLAGAFDLVGVGGGVGL